MVITYDVSEILKDAASGFVEDDEIYDAVQTLLGDDAFLEALSVEINNRFAG